MHTRPTKASGLVFGGIMAALMVLFGIIPILNFLMPIPLVLLFVRYGLRPSLLSAAATTLLMGMVLGPVPALLIVPFGVIPGLVLGYGFRRGLKPLRIGLLAVIAVMVAAMINYGYARLLVTGGADPFEQALLSPAGEAAMQQARDQLDLVLVVPPGASEEQAAAIETARRQFEVLLDDPVGLAYMLMPLMLIAISVPNVWITYVVARLLLKRLGHTVPPSTPFGELALPGWVAALFFLVYALAATQAQAGWWFGLVANLYYPLALVMSVAGVAVLYGVLRKREVSKGMAIAIIVGGTLMLADVGLQILTFVAMLDPIFDIRGLGHGWFKRPDEVV